MVNKSKWILPEPKRKQYIAALTAELVVLRTKADVSQDDMAGIIGVSRQTYGAIERKNRKMSWNTFLSLIMFFDYNPNTHHMLRQSGAFPFELFTDNGVSESGAADLSALLGDAQGQIMDSLDEKALESIRTMIMIEYARCTNTPGAVIIKSFDGQNFTGSLGQTEVSAMQALKKIKETNATNI